MIVCPAPGSVRLAKTRKDLLSIALFVVFLAQSEVTLCASVEQADVAAFVASMASSHGFDPDELTGIIRQARISEQILRAISRPAEAKPWFEYRPIFVTAERAQAGRDFLREHIDILNAAERRFGVPPEIVVAIVGVETYYGRHAGNYRVIDSLVTLGFGYPKRASFFRGELEQFLLLSREQNLNPLSITGSYAGAMGMPQFISSSYRAYAIDFDEDGLTDIWENPADVVGSVANYLALHGWRAGELIAVKASPGSASLSSFERALEPSIDLDALLTAGMVPSREIQGNPKVALIELESRDGSEFWLGLQNFYAITRYNHSALYAMAVYQLAEMIRSADESS